MGHQHCANNADAKAFIRGLRKASEKSKTYKNTTIKKTKNRDGSYHITWRTYWRM